MQVQVNGKTRQVVEGESLVGLIEELSLTPQRIAVEINKRIVRREEWGETELHDGDRIEIVHFVGGGAHEGNAALNMKVAVAGPVSICESRGVKSSSRGN